MSKKKFEREAKSDERVNDDTPMLRHDAREEEFTPAECVVEEEAKLMDEHLAKYLGKVDSVFHELVSDTIHIDVNYVKAKNENECSILVTSGMSALPMTVPKEAEGFEYAELMVYLPSGWDISDEGFKEYNNYWPVYWLKQLARLPHDYSSFLSIGHTIPNGDPQEPLASNTELSGFVLMPPVNEVQDFWTLKVNEKKSINYYVIMPLFEEEMNYKLEYGLEALVDKFEEKLETLPIVISPDRECCCK